MKDEEVKNLHDATMTGFRASLLLGQITGCLYNLIKKSDTVSVRLDLLDLYKHITETVNDIYYKPQEEKESNG